MNTTAHPQATASRWFTQTKRSTNVIVWLALMAYLALIKVLLDTFFPQAFSDPAQATLFAWPALGIIGALGLLGAWLAATTGFPSAWDAQIACRWRLLLPILLGASFAGFQILVNEQTRFSALQAAHHGVTQQYTSFAPMLLIFPAAAIIVEVIFRLFPVTLLLWIISNVVLKGRGQAHTFWALAIVSAVLYVLTQISDLLILPAPVMIILMIALFAENATQAALFRKYGFLAAIVLRMTFYIVWNVLYVH